MKVSRLSDKLEVFLESFDTHIVRELDDPNDMLSEFLKQFAKLVHEIDRHTAKEDAHAEGVRNAAMDAVRVLKARFESPFLSVEEAAEYATVPVGTIRDWVARGLLTRHGGGKRAAIEKAQLDDLVRAE